MEGKKSCLEISLLGKEDGDGNQDKILTWEKIKQFMHKLKVLFIFVLTPTDGREYFSLT